MNNKLLENSKLRNSKNIIVNCEVSLIMDAKNGIQKCEKLGSENNL